MADFKTAYRITMKHEGAYSNVSGDNGGETYNGITRKFFPHWPGWKIVDAHKPLKHNQKIPSPELHELTEEFYKEEFWDKLNGDQIESQDLANQVFDFAVNAGVSAAKQLLEKS